MNKLSSLQLWQSILCVITMLVQDAGMFDNVHYEIFGAVLLTTNMIIILMIAPVVVVTVFRSLQEVTASIRRGSLGRTDRVVLLTTRRAPKKTDSAASGLRVRSFTTLAKFRNLCLHFDEPSLPLPSPSPSPSASPSPQPHPQPHPSLTLALNLTPTSPQPQDSDMTINPDFESGLDTRGSAVVSSTSNPMSASPSSSWRPESSRGKARSSAARGSAADIEMIDRLASSLRGSILDDEADHVRVQVRGSLDRASEDRFSADEPLGPLNDDVAMNPRSMKRFSSKSSMRLRDEVGAVARDAPKELCAGCLAVIEPGEPNSMVPLNQGTLLFHNHCLECVVCATNLVGKMLYVVSWARLPTIPILGNSSLLLTRDAGPRRPSSLPPALPRV